MNQSLHISQGEKNVQPDWDPQNIIPRLYQLSFPAPYTFFPLSSQQSRTVTFITHCLSLISKMICSFKYMFILLHFE
jgi:hypothetical protein